MEDNEWPHEEIIAALKKVKGLVDAVLLLDEDREKIHDLEHDAEERSLMGLGKVINTGVTEVLNTRWTYVAMTSMDFDWGCHATLVMKKGDEVVGEEIRDPETISRLSKQKNVWFMHRNFVVYKDKITFPQDVMKKICHFEIPCLPADWCNLEDAKFHHLSVIFANPATPCDIFLKNRYFDGLDEKGLGTILVGIKF